MIRPTNRMTAVVLAIAVVGSVAAAALTRSVRDENEERLVAQRAEGIVEILDGVASSFESDLRAAAVHAGAGSPDALADYIESNQDDTTDGATWAVLERTTDGIRPVFVVPEGAPTYFDDAELPSIDHRLEQAFDGDFVIAGLLGAGANRRLGLAAGAAPGDGTRAVYLEFPLLAAAADGATGGGALFEDVDVGMYVGLETTDESLIFGTFDGPPPESATRRSMFLGDDRIVVVVQATEPLAGRLAQLLPSLVLGLGIVMGVIAAAVVEMANRKRLDALALADELHSKHEALELAVHEQQRAEAGMRVAQRNEALGQLASGIAHDFNNLLAVIVSYAELLGRHVGEEGRSDVAEILSAAERGASLTRQLLLFAKQGREGEDDGERADLHRVVGEMGRFLQRTVGEDISFVIDVPDERAIVSLTGGELEQILLNLVVNARQAIASSGLISIRARTSSKGDEVVIEIADDGAGMSPETAARAVEPFFSTHETGKGTGLGLTIVDGLVRSAGGSLTIDSVEGKGTTITVSLPIVDTGPAQEPERPVTTGRGDRGATVLLVEDEGAVRRAVRRMLEDDGYRVHEAHSGVEAVDRFIDASVPDVLLTDVMMPGGLSGREVAERFRTRHPQLPVVFISGYNEESLIERGLVSGPVNVLVKPFGVDELLAAVAAAIATNESAPSSS